MRVRVVFGFLKSIFFLMIINPLAYAKTIKICDDVKDPPVLNPLNLFDDKSYNLFQQIFDGLIQFDPNGNLQPALSISWEQLNPLTVRFHLRQGVTFHNGEEFNAEVVRYSIEKHLNPKNHFPGMGFILTIASVTVVDKYTVDINTKMPDSLLLRRLGAFVFMLPPEATELPSFDTHPIGTGPFQFKNWEKGQRIELEKNMNYWDLKSDSPDAIEFHFVPASKQVEYLTSGRLDLISDLPGTFTYTVASNPLTKVIKKLTFYTVCGNFNTQQGPLKDVRIRRAINHAINKDDLIRYDILGNGNIIASLSMEGEIGHNSQLTPYEYNPEKALKLMRDAGVKTPIKLRTITKVQGDRTAGIFKENLQKIGIELDILSVSGGEVVQKMASKDFDLGITGFSDVMGHIFFPQSILFYSKSPFSLHSDPQFDKKLEDLVAELDPVKHEKLAQELDKYVHDQALAIFTYQQIRTYGVSRTIDFIPSVTSRLYCNRISVKKK